MLKVFYWSICPHCKKTMDFLQSHNIQFEALDIEKQPPNILKQVVDANGGEDWVVPTLEYKGQWRSGEFFNEKKLAADLHKWGLM